MTKKGTAMIQRGQAITFRLPADTPDHILKQLQKLKETERRNFSSKIAEFILEGISNSLSKERETVTIPLPRQLSKEQRNWLKHSHSEALLGSVIYQLLVDPVRATAILASLTSNAVDINEALHLQEQESIEFENDTTSTFTQEKDKHEEVSITSQMEEIEDDLLNFSIEKARQEVAVSVEETTGEKEENAEDLLGDFIAQMNR